MIAVSVPTNIHFSKRSQITVCSPPNWRGFVCSYFATQVHSGATVCSFFVHSVARSNEVTDISDVDTHLQQRNKIL